MCLDKVIWKKGLEKVGPEGGWVVMCMRCGEGLGLMERPRTSVGRRLRLQGEDPADGIIVFQKES